MSAAAEFRSIVGSLPCQVHWGDCDPAGIIFYPTYFRWIDAASWALFELAGFGPKWMREQHMAMPLVSAACEFLAPAVTDGLDQFLIRMTDEILKGRGFAVFITHKEEWHKRGKQHNTRGQF